MDVRPEVPVPTAVGVSNLVKVNVVTPGENVGDRRDETPCMTVHDGYEHIEG